MSENRRFGWTAALALGLVAATMMDATAAAGVLAAGNLPGTFGLRFGPDGRLYVCSFGGLAVLDLAQGQLVDLIGPERGVVGPEDVVFGPDGSMYWAAMFTGDVGRRAPDGTTTLQAVGPGVNSLFFSADGRLFVTEPWFTDTVWELDPALVDPPGLVAAGLGGVKNPELGADGLLYAALMWRGEVVRFALDDPAGTMEVLASDLPGPFTARFGPDGMLYVVERSGFTIERMDPATGAHATVVTLPFGPDNLAFAPTGAMFVTSYTDGAVVMALPDGSLQTIVPGGLTLPAGVAVVDRPDGESVFVGNLFSLREIDGATGAERSVERFRFPAVEFGGAVSVAAAGERLVLSNFFPPGRARVQLWDPELGEVVDDLPGFMMPVNAIAFGDDLVVADLGLGEGQARVLLTGDGGTTVLADVSDQIYAPLGLAAHDGDLWVGDWATGMIWQLYDDGQELPQPVPVAQGLSGPEGMAVDRDGSLLVVEGTAGRVSRVRPASGAVTPVVGGLLLSNQGQGTIPPFGLINGVDVGPSGAIYVVGDLGPVLYRLQPRTLYLPGAAHVAGRNGSRWTTDLEVHNRGDETAAYTVELLRIDADNSAPAALAFQLEPDTGVRYPDVVGELFDATGAGALRLTAVGGDVMATAHTRTAGGGGHYGQFIEAMDTGHAAGPGAELRMIQLEGSAAARTNLGAVNAGPLPLTLDVALYAADGTPTGSRQLALEPFGTTQINDVFTSLHGSSAGDGDLFAVVSCSDPEASFFAYASVVDNGTNDPVFVPAR